MDRLIVYSFQSIIDAQKNGVTWKFVAVADPLDQLGAIGAGADNFYLSLSTATSANPVGDFEIGIDRPILGIATAADFSKVTLTQKGADTLVTAGGKDLALLTGIQSSTVTSNSFMFS